MSPQYGGITLGPGQGSTGAVSATAAPRNYYWCASFCSAVAKRVAKITCYQTYAASAASVNAYICGDDANYLPDYANPITNGAAMSHSCLSAAGFLQISFAGSPSISANTRYWLVLKNTTTTSVAFGSMANNNGPGVFGHMWGRRNYTTSWQAGTVNSPCILVEYTDGTVEGFCPSNNGLGAAAADCAYYTDAATYNEIGNQFVTPANCQMSIVGLQPGLVTSTGTAGNVFGKLYVNGIVWGVTRSIPYKLLASNTSAADNSPVVLLFPQTITVPPSSTIAIMLCHDTGDASSNYVRGYQVTFGTNLDDPKYLASRMFCGTLQKATKSASGWLYTPSAIFWHNYILDKAQPFLPAPINRRTSTGR